MEPASLLGFKFNVLCTQSKYSSTELYHRSFGWGSLVLYC